MINKMTLLIDNLINRKFRHLFRFAVVGVLNTGVDFAVFSLLQGIAGAHYTVSQICAYSAGVLNSFVMNKLWTFDGRNATKKTHRQFVQFAAVNAVSLGMTLAGFSLLTDRLGINVYIVKAVVTVLAQAVNFFGYKLWVFAK